LEEETFKRAEKLMGAVKNEHERLNLVTKANVLLELKIIDNVLWMIFSRENESSSVRIPLPTKNDRGIEVLINNDITRVICDYWIEVEQKRLSYYEIVERLICENVNTIMPTLQNESSLLSKIIKAFDKNTVSFMVGSLQRLINDMVNMMPLHETDMNSWAMNHRLIIIDPAFDEISDPNHRLEYQVEKNKKYYSKFGWTAIGLSDGILADKNVILTTDLRQLTPFQLYHNPQRNLYSTLGMKGDELPKVRSRSMDNLVKRGISRKGWNFVTAILDTPLNFEDQILVDNRHRGLFHTIARKFVVYGDKLRTKVNDEVKTNDTLGTSSDNLPVKMNMRCDEAKVTKIRKELTDLAGEQMIVFTITVEGKRFLRDGSKFSNLHGNKGIIRFKDLGYAIDPRTGEEIPIDVMISGQSINKRANFGQILEALSNNLEGRYKRDVIERLDRARFAKEEDKVADLERILAEEIIVVKDNFQTKRKNVESALEAEGFPKDGTWMVNTYCGEFSTMVGKMFWGVTKDAEDQLWEGDRTILTNNRDLRTSGLKFSHVEIKALITRFGVRNPVVEEILSFAQGVEILSDELKILKSARGEIDRALPVIDARSVRSVDSSKGIFHTIDEIKGTVVDEEFMPDGFVLQLPADFQVIVEKDNLDDFICGMPQDVEDTENKIVYQYNKIFIPNALLRRCWKHRSGKWGLSNVGAFVNRVVECCHKFTNSGEEDDNSDNYMGSEITDYGNLMRAIGNYFINVTKMMGTKRGEINTYGMAVRYPHSTHATAALADNLPVNTIEIYRDMAKELKVKTGDVVLAERFPCLGFMSIRPQWVKVTDDPQCKYTIRVSNNSLVSMNLDFDGDTLFLASLHTPQAKQALLKEMKAPNKICEDVIEEMNRKKTPRTKEMALSDLEIRPFPKPNSEEHADLVRKATGVKSHTGPVIALAYNLMRIMERNVPYENVKEHANIEVLLDFLGNTVFKQKHGIKSLQEEATDAVCAADVDKMVSLGFDRDPSLLLCNLIIKEAASIGITDLMKYHMRAKERGGSKIINTIVRNHNKIYFASRALLGPFNLLKHLEAKPVDMPSHMMERILKAKKEKIAEKLGSVRLGKAERRFLRTSPTLQKVYRAMADFIDGITIGGQDYCEAAV